MGSEEMSSGHHCENVTTTLIAGQFSKKKSDAAGRFPPSVVGTKSGEWWGRRVCVCVSVLRGKGWRRVGVRLCTKRDVLIK